MDLCLHMHDTLGRRTHGPRLDPNQLPPAEPQRITLSTTLWRPFRALSQRHRRWSLSRGLRKVGVAGLKRLYKPFN